MAELTPMMKQYFETKKKYPDTILMFRLGDFYEMFFDDAVVASRELELVLTGRSCGQEERAPMCGVPFHSADSYMARLVAKGYKVAVCEQTEDPALAKGLVKREVTRVLTPGTVIENSMLNEGRNNFLASVFSVGETAGICFVDVSTGAVNLTEVSAPSISEKIINEIGRFMPSEVVFNSAASSFSKVFSFIANKTDALAEELGDGYFNFDECSKLICSHFGKKDLSELELSHTSAAVPALGAALKYLTEVQKNDLENISEISFYSDANFMKLDVSALRNLEIVETLRNREKKGSLLWVLDKTRTPMGKRMIRSWLERPLVSVARITKRHNAVGELVSQPLLRSEVSELMSGIHDLERLMTRISFGTASAKELRALSSAAAQLPYIKEKASQLSSAMLCGIEQNIDTLEDIRTVIDAAIVDEPPFSVREGGMIKDGFHPELDSLRDIVVNGKDYIASIQQKEQERTGIKKLKIGYNRVFGYYIEISNSYKELVPDEYIRKQTLANCERYITQELKDLESKVLGAQDRIVKLEYEIFDDVRKKASDELARVQRTASAIAELDVLCSFAQVAAENNYSCPQISASPVIRITEGRHPVVEKMLDGEPFVPNDTELDCSDNRCAIITGPNMAGKSTYMRQVALIAIMAQAGSFVPASSAEIGIVDSVFTRIGASDDLSAGQSTFMVEMSEVAAILNNATSKSLIIFDEIGRGTSTFDGMSIARAVLEYAADKKKIGAKTLFATHYHELTELEGQIEGVKNYNIAVKKRGDDITFLRRIVRGGADGSYGIEVAKLAGVPKAVVDRAKKVLREIEESGIAMVKPRDNAADNFTEDSDMQVSFEDGSSNEIIDKLKKIDVNTLTPIEAMSVLYELTKNAKEI